MTDRTNERPAPQYEPLPSSVDGAIAAIQSRINSWRARLTGDNPVAALQSVLDQRTPVDPAYLEQRDKIAALGLDPDVLAPLPREVKNLGSYVGALTYPEQGVREWVEAAGTFTDTEVEDIIAGLELVPGDVLKWLDSVDDGEFTDDDGRTVVVRTGERVNPLSPPAGTRATGRQRQRD